MRSSLSHFKMTPVHVKDVPTGQPRVIGEYHKLVDRLLNLSKDGKGLHIEFESKKVAHHRMRLLRQYATERRLLVFIELAEDRISRYVWVKTIEQAKADGDDIPEGLEG